MPSNRAANEIRRSLFESERFEDFAYLFDNLLYLREPYLQARLRQQPELKLSEYPEYIVERILCVVFPDKPAKYVSAMQQFRLGFRGVASRPELQLEFTNSVKMAAIALDNPNAIVWQPSLYFDLPERMKYQDNWY